MFRKWNHHEKDGNYKPVNIIALPQVGNHQTWCQYDHLTECKTKPHISNIRFAYTKRQLTVVRSRFCGQKLRIKFRINFFCACQISFLFRVIGQIVDDLKYKHKAAVPVDVPFVAQCRAVGGINLHTTFLINLTEFFMNRKQFVHIFCKRGSVAVLGGKV